MNKLIVILSFLVLTLSGCGEQAFYNKTFSIPGGSWKQQMRPKFKVNIKDASKSYTFIFTVRTTTDYAYNNLWFYLNSTSANKTKAREPFEIKIANQDGTWIGNKSGSIVETEIKFNKRKFPAKGTYLFELEQGVTMSQLDHVVDVGLLIEKDK